MVLFSQQITNTILEKPKKYQNPVDENDLAPTNERMSLQAWMVWSDRQDNQTFTSPQGGQPFKKLGFLEPFYVIDEEGEYVRIARDPAPTALALSQSAEDCGWIHKRNLILWSSCLMTERGKIPNKAMILNTISQLKKRSGKPDIVEFCADPADSTAKTGKASQLFQFFFVIKSTPSSVLLARDQLISMTRSVSDNIVGWAPKERVTLWDHRVAIEPNWDREAADERKIGMKAKIFGDGPTASEYKTGKTITIDKVLWDNDPLEKRMQGEIRRFPVLAAAKRLPGILQVGAMGEIYAEDMTKFEQTIIANVQQKMGVVNTFKRNVNVVFVIDGTTSMGPYFKAMAQAIVHAMPLIAQYGQAKNRFKFGALIYRDSAEGMKRLAEIMPLQADPAKVRTFLENATAGDKNDQDEPEAVYYGLNAALRTTGLNPKETNIIILVGDAGSHNRRDRTQVDPAQIIKTMLYMDCHFVVFQVHHPARQPYADFITQMKSIAEKAADEKYAQVQKLDSKSGPRPIFVSDGATLVLENSTFVSAVYGLSDGAELKPELLTDRVTTEVGKLDKYIDASAGSINEMIDGKAMGKAIAERRATIQNEGKMYSTAFAPGILNHLLSAGLTAEDLKVLAKDKYQLFIDGFVSMKMNSQKYDLFKRVLFLSRSELVTLSNIMTDLARSVDERKDLKDAWIAILKTYVGKIDEQELRMDLAQAQEKVFGLPGTNEFLKNVRISDITDPAVFPDRQLRHYVNRITSMSAELRKIADMPETEFRFSFRSNDQTYFWIAEDMIP
jgi:hypothetical protein